MATSVGLRYGITEETRAAGIRLLCFMGGVAIALPLQGSAHRVRLRY